MRSALWIYLLVAPASAGAALVAPQLGGGSPGTTTAMKHADIFFESGSLVVHLDTSVATPRLRPLLPADAFDPAAPYALLSGKAYNAQYGWNAGGFISLPPGAGIWIEVLQSTPGLEVYQAPVDANGYAPILGTQGTSLRWKWSGRMSHNYYAATNFASQSHEATYRVYLGDSSSGTPLAGYGSTEVTFAFAPPGDYDGSGSVDPLDKYLWQQQYGATGPQLAADGTGDGLVDVSDYTVWRDALGAQLTPATQTIPEPSTVGLAILVTAFAPLLRL
ncbi:hypothetical protein [Botrimarina hoheduenensis]|uniref:PEP-CTERM protein-sorting domain-containing protein n=1 Tax=Botrimarina hoheduenensis TaxID=2528000 RepID=A0A5C5W8S7_9BACT|nr:hypothetical protein [Botrimarina hoheduenensis]TWT47296.1 hypothetical protein Pla111_09090 [Botrimarina hoheduenensis]